VTEHADQLRTAFETHEHLAPDAAAVYGRVQELSRSYQRRRWGVQAAGGAVLGVSLIAGAISLPGLLTGQKPDSASVGAAATMPNMKPSATAAPSEAEQELQRAAYFKAGYDYDDAVALARLWKSKDEIGLVKAEAGRRLLAGETLPIKPTPGPDVTDPKTEAQLRAFFTAGYSYADAEKLAALWKTADPYAAKIEGGKRLLAGKKLPIRPSQPEVRCSSAPWSSDGRMARGMNVLCVPFFAFTGQAWPMHWAQRTHACRPSRATLLIENGMGDASHPSRPAASR
jgi:hypothetical protein